MAFRLYIDPAIGAGTFTDRRRPKYVDGSGDKWSAYDYGFQPIFLLGGDLSAALDSMLAGAADVTAFPFDLSGTVGAGNLQAAKNALEAALIPAQTISGSDTWQTVARMVAGMFQFMQRLNGILGNTVVIDTSAKLNAQWRTIPANIQTAVLQAAQSFGYDTSFIGNNTQIREILTTFANAWGSQPFAMNDYVF